MGAEDRATLKAIGFRSGVEGLRDYQRAVNYGPPLAVDGINGPMTRAAFATSRLRGKDKRYGDLSAHFSGWEFECHGPHSEEGCKWLYVDRNLLAALEKLRLKVGGPLEIISGYRCPKHNAREHGATSGQHPYGRAADIPPLLSTSAVQGLGIFTGIGSKNGRVIHVDVRPGNPANPAKWNY